MKHAYALISAWLLACAGSTEAAPVLGQVLSLDSPDQWQLAGDPGNVGKQEQWWSGPRAGAKPARVPGGMQETLGEYHGVAWYWRTVIVPRRPQLGGCYLLRFWSIDYYIEVWGNGRPVLNSLLVRENLSVETPHPVAERLLRNLLKL
jgi:hypothetical protein